jgi:hypothetical protein
MGGLSRTAFLVEHYFGAKICRKSVQSRESHGSIRNSLTTRHRRKVSNATNGYAHAKFTKPVQCSIFLGERARSSAVRAADS